MRSNDWVENRSDEDISEEELNTAGNGFNIRRADVTLWTRSKQMSKDRFAAHIEIVQQHMSMIGITMCSTSLFTLNNRPKPYVSAPTVDAMLSTQNALLDEASLLAMVEQVQRYANGIGLHFEFRLLSPEAHDSEKHKDSES